jgi:hypothetical protein
MISLFQGESFLPSFGLGNQSMCSAETPPKRLHGIDAGDNINGSCCWLEGSNNQNVFDNGRDGVETSDFKAMENNYHTSTTLFSTSVSFL